MSSANVPFNEYRVMGPVSTEGVYSIPIFGSNIRLKDSHYETHCNVRCNECSKVFGISQQTDPTTHKKVKMGP
jgi:hypothetical protein